MAILNYALQSVGADGSWSGMESELQQNFDKLGSEIPHGLSHRELRSASGSVGALWLSGDLSPLSLDSLSSLVVLALERHRAFVNESASESARKTEQLRTTVLDSLAHAIKTPLTIIRAASSGLLETYHLDPSQSQLAEMIDEQSVHMNDLTNRLLQTARIGGEHLSLQTEPVHIPELVAQVVSDFQREWPEQPSEACDSHNIDISIVEHISPIMADHEMLSSTLKELLTNAVKYSYAGHAISVKAVDTEEELTLSVRSCGPVIRPADRERVFETFFRIGDSRHTAQGTGLGLSIARRVAEAHGGQIWVTSTEADGTTFHLSIPHRSTTIA